MLKETCRCSRTHHLVLVLLCRETRALKDQILTTNDAEVRTGAESVRVMLSIDPHGDYYAGKP